MYEKAAKRATLIHRAATVASIALTVLFLLLMERADLGPIRQALFMIWAAVLVFSGIRIVGDLVSGGQRREQSNTNMLKFWESQWGDQGKVLRTYRAITLGAAAVQLAVPILLYLV